MGRLKKDHSGYHASGLWTKYQQPSVDDDLKNTRGKKKRAKWCKGKVGVEHVLRRYFWRYGWDDRKTDWIRAKCIVCDKQFHTKDSSIPLIIEIDESNESVEYPIQVKFNGKVIPIKPERYMDNSYFCYECMEWRSKY